MPGVESLLNDVDPALLAEHPENVPLWLPSALPSTSRNAQCVKGLTKLEYKLRYAQAMQALHDVRSHRRTVQTIREKMQSHIANTQKTRKRGLFDNVNSELRQAVSTYRRSRKALENLAPNEEFGKWKGDLQELQDGDICGPGHEDPATSRSRHVESWIWTTAPQLSASTEDTDLQAALRVQWCVVQQRAERYEEERELVIEEMRRTLVALEWSAKRWETFAATPPPGVSNIDKKAVAGIVAYAYKQADIRSRMVTSFVNAWYHLLEKEPSEIPWLKKFPRLPEIKRNRLPSSIQLHHPESYIPQPDSDSPDAEVTPDTPINSPDPATVSYVDNA